jgi:eukaryotic-like serine/threonine-protein kinase
MHSADDALQIDQLCDLFEAAWRSGQPLTRDAVLLRCPPRLHSQLIGELDALTAELESTPFPPPEEPLRSPTVPSPTVQNPTVPSQRFTQLTRIGSGGGGAVWRAFDHRYGRWVALKVPHPLVRDAEEVRIRFQREARAIAAIDHPGVVKVYEVTEFQGATAMVQQWIDAPSLASQLPRSTFHPRQVATIVLRLSRAVAAAHEQGVIHRDIKPANILLRDDQPILIDFGLVTEHELDSKGMPRLTQQGQPIGTPAYMSPEQAAGSVDLDPRSDLYAIGVVLYEMLCGRVPFHGSAAQVLESIQRDPPRPLRSIRRQTPKDLETICLKCLESVRTRRYESASLLADDLQRFLHHEEILARRAGVWTRSVRWCGRHPAMTGLTLMSALLLLSLGSAVAIAFSRARLTRAYAAVVQSRQETETQAAQTRQQAYLHLMARAAQELQQGNTGRVDDLLGQCPVDLREPEWRLLHALSHRETFSIDHRGWVQDGHALLGCMLRPGTSELYTAGYSGEICCWDLSGVVPPSDASPSNVDRTWTPIQSVRVGQRVTCLAVRPDGGQLAVGTQRGKVMLFDLPLRQQSEPIVLDGLSLAGPAPFQRPNPIESIAYRADGSQLLVGSGVDPEQNASAELSPSTLSVVDCKTHQRLWRVPIDRHSDVASIAIDADDQSLFLAVGHRASERQPADVGRIEQRSLNDGQWIRSYAEGTVPMFAVAVSSEKGAGPSMLAAGGGDGLVRLIELHPPFHQRLLQGHQDWIQSLRFGPAESKSATLLASISADCVVRIWDTSEGVEQFAWRGHRQSIRAMDWSKDGNQLVTAGADQSVKGWSLQSPSIDSHWKHGEGPIVDLVSRFQTNQYVVAMNLASGAGQVSLYDAASTSPVAQHAVPSPIARMAISPNQQRLAIACRDQTVRILDLSQHRWEGEVQFPYASMTAVAFLSNDRLISASFHPKEKQEQDIETEFHLWELSNHPFPTEPVRIWRSDRTKICRQMVVDPSGQWLASVNDVGEVWLRAVDRWDDFVHWNAHQRVVNDVRFDGQGRLLTASWDLTAKVWQLPRASDGLDRAKIECEPQLVLSGHQRSVKGVLATRDGARLITTGDDRTLRIWEPKAGNEVLVLDVPGMATACITLTQDDRYLVAGGNDGHLHRWDLGRSIDVPLDQPER